MFDRSRARIRFWRAALPLLSPLWGCGCGMIGSSTSFGEGAAAALTGGARTSNSSAGRTKTGAGGSHASGGTGALYGGSSSLAGAGGADAGCYRDPYLPDNYQPPCDQPRAEPSCADGWCTIEPGCFIMGDSWCQWYRDYSRSNPTQVTLTHRFRMQQFEVTQKQWMEQSLPNPSTLMDDSHGEFAGTGDGSDENCPVGNVTWVETLAFANLLSANEGMQPCYTLDNCQGEVGSGLLCDTVRSNYASVYDCPGYRLPTGAEWEYAARAGTKTTIYTGDIVDTGQGVYTCYDEPHLLPIAWYCANTPLYTQPVGQLMPNDWGLYDMIGNAGEWTQSEAKTYGSGPFVDWDAELDATGLMTNLSSSIIIRQTRGGSWNQWPNTLRVSDQGAGATPPPLRASRGPGLGFRLVQSLSNTGSGVR
jgi:formylglycine-generating enzyme